MAINKELNNNELENAFGGNIKPENLPDKFKEVKKDENELSESDLQNVYGGPIKGNDLPEEFYKENNQSMKQ